MIEIGITIFFLLGMFLLTSIVSSFRRIQKPETERLLKDSKFFFYRKFHLYFFPAHEFEGILFASICAQNITRFCYGASGFYLLLMFEWIPLANTEFAWLKIAITILLVLFFSFFVGEFFPRLIGTKHPILTFRICSPFASLFLFAVFPLTYPFLRFLQALSHKVYFDYLHEPEAKVKQEIIEIIHKADSGASLEPVDKKIIESVVTFRDRIVREVMVPRIDVFSLPTDKTIKEAAQVLEEEGYSRTPVYKETIDNMVGVLMYKDILRKYMEFKQTKEESILNAPIQTIMKGVIYTPETKKISHLLQEFRKKQVHLAIVVDEYGGTAGIVTIEDILEEIVGEIADEYDQEAEAFARQPDGSWIVDARMNILDVEEELGLKIPQEGEYDTIGGYIFHRAGTIPSKGFVIYHDDFKLEVLKSSERNVEKVRITPKEK